MSLEQFLRSVVEALDAEEIPSMLTGAVAAAYRGATRATMDVDLVIEPTAPALERFVRRMQDAGFYASPEAAREALAMRALFNVIDPESGWKADLILRKSRAFSETEFARRETVDMLGIAVSVAQVEDLIIAKLEWATLGASARQVEDVRRLLHLHGPEIDAEYVRHWVDVLGLARAWEEAMRADDGG